jgi:hypothetical protein
MRHYDEHTIELFILGSEKVAGERTVFQKHLEECYSCRELYEELTQFYASVNSKQKQLYEHADNDGQGLILKPEYRNTYPVSEISRSIPARAWRLIRKRPVVSTFSGLSMLALVAFFILKTSFGNKENPEYTRYNEQANTVEVYNSSDKLLWNMPVTNDLKLVDGYEKSKNTKYCRIVDLDGTGKNDVIISHGQIQTPRENVNTVCVYSNDKTLKQRWVFDDLNIAYLGREYHLTCITHAFLPVSCTSDPKQKDMVFNVYSTRSPNVVVRTDNHGKILGEYYHMGNFSSLTPVYDDNKTNDIFLTGVNDVEDDKKIGAVVVLMPEAITGKTEATATRGFGCSPSNAERYYLKFPFSDLDSMYSYYNIYVHRILSQPSEPTIRMLVWNSGERASFEYIFDKEFNILDIRCDDVTMQIHHRFEREHKLHTSLDMAYIDRLKKAIEYWDGTQWQHKHVKVQNNAIANIKLQPTSN